MFLLSLPYSNYFPPQKILYILILFFPFMNASLRQSILATIKPTLPEQRLNKESTTAFLKSLNSKLKDAHAILGGSGAKDTWLAGNHDVDVFVLFDYQKYSSRSLELSDLLEKALKKTFPKIGISRIHGSRDYFQLKYKSLNVEVIPILKISKAQQAKNITDVSPLHSIWVNKHTKKLKDDIRITKQFLKAHSMYGAESHIMGFSGYVVEILIAYYGSFEKLLRVSQKWKVKDVIDAGKQYPKKDALFHLNQSKTQSPLIVIDPVDKQRNAAAALSLEKFLLFQKVARNYLQKPSLDFFVKKEVSFASLHQEVQKAKHNLVFLTITPLRGKEDVVGTKLVKAYNLLQEKLTPFTVLKSGWEWSGEGQALFYFILGKRELPHLEIREGPPLKLTEFVEDFKRKNRDTFVKEGRIYARIAREHPLLKDYIRDLLLMEYFTERVSKVQSVQIT